MKDASFYLTNRYLIEKGIYTANDHNNKTFDNKIDQIKKHKWLDTHSKEELAKIQNQIENIKATQNEIMQQKLLEFNYQFAKSKDYFDKVKLLHRKIDAELVVFGVIEGNKLLAQISNIN